MFDGLQSSACQTRCEANLQLRIKLRTAACFPQKPPKPSVSFQPLLAAIATSTTLGCVIGADARASKRLLRTIHATSSGVNPLESPYQLHVMFALASGSTSPPLTITPPQQSYATFCTGLSIQSLKLTS
ncbi:hypothetical protein SRHO_G00124640 [Serrasalmus rhombeus]